MAKRYLQFENWRTGEVANRIDVTGKSEREIEKLETGMLINCDVEGGWGVNDVAVPA
jgi:hypothetical protein